MSAKLPRLNAPPHFANRVALVKQATAEFFSTRRNAKQSAPGLLQFPTHAFSQARRFDRPSVQSVAHGTLSVVGRWLSVVRCPWSVVRGPLQVDFGRTRKTEHRKLARHSALCTLHSALHSAHAAVRFSRCCPSLTRPARWALSALTAGSLERPYPASVPLSNAASRQRFS